jgi:hypothetical protein
MKKEQTLDTSDLLIESRLLVSYSKQRRAVGLGPVQFDKRVNKSV